jgi:SAM-dependent methyltransferase
LANKEDRYPCLNDKTAMTGFDGHYLYHPAWAARILAEIQPQKHVDISSILSFSAIVSAFLLVEYYEYRPAILNLNNLETGHADLVNLPFENESIESLSCMHVIEHIGLGRYGDKIDPLGDKKAIDEIKRVVAPKGNLLFVVPIGKPKIMFNAHRIYSYEQIIECFRGWKLKEFALVPDDHVKHGFIRNATQDMADKQNYGCGCFWFEK